MMKDRYMYGIALFAFVAVALNCATTILAMSTGHCYELNPLVNEMLARGEYKEYALLNAYSIVVVAFFVQGIQYVTHRVDGEKHKKFEKLSKVIAILLIIVGIVSLYWVNFDLQAYFKVKEFEALGYYG